MKREFRLSSRREFFGQSAGTLVVLNAIASQRTHGAEKAGNPFAYDVSSFQKTDAGLIAYEEAARWKAPHPEARRLAIGRDDTLFVSSGNYLTSFTTAGERVMEIALTEPSRCIGIGNNGEIYLGLRDHVEVFDSKGNRQATWDPSGKKSWLTGIAMTENDLFVADAGNRLVLRYDKSGKLLQRLGEKNKDRNVPGFIVPSPFFDLEMAHDGLLRVTNPGRHRVELYTRDGDFEGSWGDVSMGIRGFCGCCNPVNLALLADGRYVTCEKGLPRVKIYSANGQFESVVAGVETFAANAKACGPSDCTAGGLDAVVDSQGRIIILDFVTGDVRVMKSKT